MIEIIPLTGLPEVRPGDDLAAMLRAGLARVEGGPRPKDILVVTQKIVSTAENLFVDLADVTPGAEALRLAGEIGKEPRVVEVVLRESVGVVRAVPGVLITRHHSGCVMANSGVDQSNIGPDGEGRLLLLPRDPDASAQRLRAALGADAPAVIISDSFGRPWRVGVTNVAIGAAGLPALLDLRGEPDRDGRLMQVTQIALGDQIACAAGLVMGEGGEGIPAVVVRGFAWTADDRPAADLIRPLAQDLFR